MARGARDPSWYRRAIIYELPVRSFFDANDDGIGDFPGLIEKLDYIESLGVTCLWLLPFFPSPLRDDGYDIADYRQIHPSYGTLDDFKRFLDAAHERRLHVVDRARAQSHVRCSTRGSSARGRRRPDSAERDYYVWSDTDSEVRPTRAIIFVDSERPTGHGTRPRRRTTGTGSFITSRISITTTPPSCRKCCESSTSGWRSASTASGSTRCRIWSSARARPARTCPRRTPCSRRSGGTSTIAGPHCMLLAEANQWPAEVRAYFGDGDECHMAYHFPLMPRMFMGLHLEDRQPIVDIMQQTPAIPDICQWALFLRNHDELTLEMVTDEERDYMYLAYSADPQAGSNLGIRRRLAPLVGNNRRRIELLNSLLFSFPGTPIVYYGDEIGMGDNTYLGDRNGVRTPMQWTSDRNARFSRADPARLYSPVIMDPIYGYQAVNVESQERDGSSLLQWMKNLIGLRKLFPAFGLGSLEFLDPDNRKVLAYVRRHEADTILCVANLSRSVQPVELDLSAIRRPHAGRDARLHRFSDRAACSRIS